MDNQENVWANESLESLKRTLKVMMRNYGGEITLTMKEISAEIEKRESNLKTGG